VATRGAKAHVEEVRRLRGSCRHFSRRLVGDAAAHVGRHSRVNFLGVRQVQTRHGGHKAFQVLGEARVEALFFPNGSGSPAEVVVRGVHHAGVGQSEELFLHRLVKRFSAAALCDGMGAIMS